MHVLDHEARMPALTTATDAELVTRAADGEQTAFAELFERHVDRVHDHVARWSRDSTLAADATQEAFVSLLGNLDSLRDGQAVLAWLLRTARNRAIDQLRRRQRERERLDTAIAPAVLAARTTDRESSPEIAAMSHDTAELVWEVAAGLDDRTFTVLDLHVRQELSGPEIAAVMDTTPDNANVLVHRMRERMRALFGAAMLLRLPHTDCAELESLRASAPDPVDLPTARRIRDHAEECITCGPRRARAIAPLRAYGALAQVRAPVAVRTGVTAAAAEHFGTATPSRLRHAVPVALALLLLAGVGGIALGLRSSGPVPEEGPPTAIGEVVPSPSPSPTPEPSPTPTLDSLASPSPVAVPPPEPTVDPVGSPSPSPSPTVDPTPTTQLAVQVERPAAGSTFDATDQDDQGRPAAVVPVSAAVAGGTQPEVTWTSSLAPGQPLLRGTEGEVLLWLSADCTDTPHTLTATATDQATEQTATSTLDVTILGTCADLLDVTMVRPAAGTTLDGDDPDGDGTFSTTFELFGQDENDQQVDWVWRTDRQSDGELLREEDVSESRGTATLDFPDCQGATSFVLVVEAERDSDGSMVRLDREVEVDCSTP